MCFLGTYFSDWLYLGTTQACLFRDSYAPITGASLAVYGLSTDSPKANTTFATKQKLPYPLLVRFHRAFCLHFPCPPLPYPLADIAPLLTTHALLSWKTVRP